METISLSSFCKEYDLAKSTVYKRAQALRINVSEGLSLEDCDRLLVEFNKVPVALVVYQLNFAWFYRGIQMPQFTPCIGA
jgi:hypothetical protein